MNEYPLVSIICLCYNHEKFLEEALLSAINQEYPNKEIIIVDDFSTDSSVLIIEKLVAQYPEIMFISNEHNMGNCQSFNKAFEKSRGTYLIDFSTDDVMLPDKIKKQVDKFLTLPEKYGVVYSDAEIIDEKGAFLAYHHKYTKRALAHPEGDIFIDILRKYFICPPTMMMKRTVLEKSGGYNFEYAYEDFDFWVISARDFYYGFIPDVLMKRRIVSNSLSLSFFTLNNSKTFQTTQSVLADASLLCRNEKEIAALAYRVKFEMKHAFLMEEFSTAKEYKKVLVKINSYDKISSLVYFLSDKKIRLFWLYKYVLKYKGFYSLR
ncbi:MAG TPA: glycosyltransferase [Cytophagaceae bacterium]|jgi:glycosyltransferase involved in cell wall biosynthesis|nr:glycosyltransferase [Cytophagaceae bacterium]